MAQFIRDEKRTYPFTWLAIGGVFAAVTGWAVYAEFVTRVPWQKNQRAFFEMELEQSRQSLQRAGAEWEQQIKPQLEEKLARKKAIEESMGSGEYKREKDRLAALQVELDNAELQKTFGSSDLDEAYYYRNLAEYDRDAAAVEVRRLYREAVAAEDPKKANAVCDAMYADPPPPGREGGVTEKIHRLEVEIARAQAHVAQIDQALGSAPASVRTAMQRSKAAENDVIGKLRVEVEHQHRVDAALAQMARIEGPADPPLAEKDPQKRAEEKKRERARVCQGHEDTRNCISWTQIEPVDAELKALDLDISKRRRGLADAELRSAKADERANPKVDLENLVKSLVGPYQIQQVVLGWMDFDREVDIEQVDRCHTCHMGIDSGSYVSGAIPRSLRTHPRRSTLLSVHPVDKFGCTACHQGQGRATDDLAHSGWKLHEKHGKERWHFDGDHYWEDPLLPVGALHRVVVDERNDQLEVKVHKAKWESVKLDHKSPEVARTAQGGAAEYRDESELLGALQEKVAALVDADAGIKAKWHAVVRKLDNRVQIGLEQNDPTEVIPAKEVPAFGVRFPKPEVAEMLGFEAGEMADKSPLQTATRPPSVPVRSDSMPAVEKDGRYSPPRGELGLQIPDEARNRFIEALPEVESGCLKCHSADADLRTRGSRAKLVGAKLEYEKAEAHRKKDPEGYKRAHDGSDDLPSVPADPSKLIDPVPTLAEGRALFRSLNCTGCHILDGFPWDRNAGPALDNVTAKSTPGWILSWLRDPRGFRAKTSMPNLWPKPLDPASKRPLPPGSPEYQKWEKQMREETVAVASFLVERSDAPASRPGAPADAKPLRTKVAGYADVPGSSAEKGKRVFEAYGCQGCHARSENDTAEEKLPEAWRGRERDLAPTLANMAAKTTADWIAYWVEDPSRYWHGTKMPNLRLTREEAASVGKYVASLAQEPVAAAKVDPADVSLVEDPAKRAEKVRCGVAGGASLSRVECGEKTIGYYGCFGCHQIGGFEGSAPVAPELSGFAKKDVTTLDFGYAIADHHLQTTETFATLKLDSPRIYRRDRIELKMADFDLSPREIRALTVFLKGLVNGRPRSEYAPSEHPEYAAALEGRQLVLDLNCRGCHVLEERGGDIDQFRSAQLSADPQARAPFLNGEGMRVQPEWLFSFLKDPGKHGIRPWLHPEWAYGDAVPEDKLAVRMPTFALSNEQVTAIVRYFASWDGQEYPYQAPKVKELSEQEKLYTLTHMLSADAANCLSCHFQGDFPVERGKTELAKMAPDLNLVAKRLRPEWVRAWLLRPQNWMPYTKMTAFWATTDREKDSPMWPSEADPFRSPPMAWDKVAGFPAVTGEQQAELVRDFLFGLPPGAVFPKPGEEADSPLVKNGAGARAEAAAEGKDDKGGKGKGEKKPKEKEKKKTGAVPGPVRF